jgi:hypothetical protein
MLRKRDTLQRNAEQQFQEPQRVLEDQNLSDEQKIQVLLNWQLDLIELQRATDENMPSVNSPAGEVAEKLRKVNDALERIRSSSTIARSI